MPISDDGTPFNVGTPDNINMPHNVSMPDNVGTPNNVCKQTIVLTLYSNTISASHSNVATGTFCNFLQKNVGFDLISVGRRYHYIPLQLEIENWTCIYYLTHRAG